MTQAEASWADALGLPFAANAIAMAAGERETHGAEPRTKQSTLTHPPRAAEPQRPPHPRHLLWHAPEVLWFLCSKHN